jgi:hypothetical protein
LFGLVHLQDGGTIEQRNGEREVVKLKRERERESEMKREREGAKGGVGA